MPLAAGTKLGPYEILAPVGAGGMGEVYRARDTRLDRTVAIKVLPKHLADTPEARQRFEREARAVSSLNHPHICALYDVSREGEAEFLVMEFLEGETLAKRIEKGALATPELLCTAIEIADALEKAHRHGVIHRDLKPGNIMLTKSGAKLMDFGLAKSANAAAAAPSSSLTMSLNQAAVTEPLTAKGTIVGTFQYMSPEQVEGQESDARADIFAFGAVLYEMATGKRAFEGKSQASVIAAILEREPPPISTLQPMSPPALDRVVKICLAKDPDERFQSAHDLKLQLEWIRDAGSQAGVPAPVIARRRISHRVAWAFAGIFVVATVFFAWMYFRLANAPALAIVSQVPPPANANFAFGGSDAGPPVISPDGERLAFAAAGSDGKRLLWVRPLNAVTAQALAGTDGATFPFWSPDSHYLGFFANGKLNRIEASGGPPLAIADAPNGRGGAWNRDGTILFTPDTNGPVYRVPASGGTPQPVTKPNLSRQETSHRWPQFLPDGKHFLLYAHGGAAENNTTYAASLDGGEPKLLLRGDSNAIYAPPGYLLFIRQGTLMAQRFDPSGLLLIGEAMPLAEHAGVNLTVWRGILTASENGILTYEVGAEESNRRLIWFDRNGKQIEETGAAGDYRTASLSPDGRKLAVTLTESGTGNADIWVYDLTRGVQTRLTFSPGINAAASWTPDGKTIVFLSNRSGQYHLYQESADGTGAASPLLVDDAAELYPDLSSDGRYVIFEHFATQAGSHTEIWALPMFGDHKPLPVIQNPQFDVIRPALSPDSKWLAYVSPESGRREVYVVPFGQGGGKWQVSGNGGGTPRWRHDGKELFYLSPDNKIMSAQISEQGASLVIGKVASLFPANPAVTPGWAYDVSADGKKFVVITLATQQAAAPLTLVVNWPALLKQR
ncbi:MAG: protein kinase domain-containing protein [Candidatus Acidiferrales bacterium]